MADEFNPISTQEEFDARVTEIYGNVRDLQSQVEALTGQRDAHANTIAQLQSQVKGYQTNELKSRIAAQKGIPAEMAARLSGETEKDIAADADAVAAILKALKGPAPLFEPNKNTDVKTADMTSMLRELRGE